MNHEAIPYRRRSELRIIAAVNKLNIGGYKNNTFDTLFDRNTYFGAHTDFELETLAKAWENLVRQHKKIV